MHQLDNGCGKSTICALLRVMLYGLNTGKRDSGKGMADKNRYQPANGAPMEGHLTLRWNNREVLLSRTTGRGNPMQEFAAIFTDTGEKCTLLTAKNCGQVLLGMGEDAFLSSTFVDGTDMARSSEELQELVTAMAQSGDTHGFYFDSMRRLGRWKLDFDSGNGHGERPQVQADLQALQTQIADQKQIVQQITAQAQLVEHLRLEVVDSRQAYEQAYQDFANEMASTGGMSSGLVRDYDHRIAKMEDELLDEGTMRALENKLTEYEGAQRLESERRAELQAAQTAYDCHVPAPLRKQPTPKPMHKMHGLAFAMGILFLAIAVFALTIGMEEFAPKWEFGQALMWAIASGCALPTLFCWGVVLWSWFHVPTAPEEPIDTVLEKLEDALTERLETYRIAQYVCNETKTALQEAVMRIENPQFYEQALAHVLPPLPNIEQALDRIATYQQNAQIVAHMKQERREMLLAQKSVPTEKGDAEQHADDLHAKMLQTQEQMRTAETTLARLQAYQQPEDAIVDMEQDAAQMVARLQEIACRCDAVQLAATVLQHTHQKMSEKMSPQIVEVASALLSYLTDEAYTKVQVDANLRAIAVDASGRSWQANQLSAGTYDQVYLSVRLAVCTVLTGAKKAPIILDDPFTTWDVDRTVRGIELLKHLAGNRQIILFTCR